MSQTIKRDMDAKINEQGAKLDAILAQMPTYFRTKRWQPVESYVAFKPINGEFTAEDMRKKFNNLQSAVKDLWGDMSDNSDAFREFYRSVMNSWNTLVQGYDIQGRVILAICKRLDIDFDQLVEEHVKGQK